MVGVAGFEPATLWSQTRCATRLRYTPSEVLLQYLFIFSKYKDSLNKGNFIKIWYINHMIIECINCNKQFEINSELIPANGRTVQCGSCNHIWFFKPKKINKIKVKSQQKIASDTNFKNKKISDENLVKKIDEVINKKDKALIKYEKSTKISVDLFFRYTIVFIISFTALILFLETFKSTLINVFPNLEIILFSFYETLKDVILFIKDLFK